MGIRKLQVLAAKLPEDSPLRAEIFEIVTKLRNLRTEKVELNQRNQDLLKLLQAERKRRNDLNAKVQTNRITGLPNHTRMIQDLGETLSQDIEYLEEHRGALFFIRLDKSFTAIQTTLKPQMTEWILYQIASRISETAGEDAQIYHSRENEFMVILNDNLHMKEYSMIGRKLRQEIRKPHILTGHNIHIDCHIGISLYPQFGREKSYLLQNADIALQFAEEHGKEIIFYHPRLRDQVIEKMDLQNSIIKALEQQAIQEIGKQFEIYYQPIIHMEEAGEDEPGSLFIKGQGRWKISDIGAEALIRWHHPEKGTIAPDRFIPIAEETGLIIPIGNWIIYSVAEQIRTWLDDGLKMSAVSVNLSTRQFHSDTLTHTVRTAMKNNRLTSDIFRFEITESSLAQNPDQMIRTMWELHDEGVYFYIDDFGTGYSSLSYVHQMPIKRIKIDKSFVLNLGSEKREKVIIRTIIAMARELGFGLVAEGVEEMDHLAYLLGYGVRSFQGFFFARPMKADDFAKFLSDPSHFNKIEDLFN